MIRNKTGSKIMRLASIILCLTIFMAANIISAVRPSAFQPDNTAEISVCKHMITYSTQDEFRFRLEPVEAWINANSDPAEDGRKIDSADMPMPVNGPKGNNYREITISGFSGQTNLSKTGSFGQITFIQPGWYMYKVTEVTPQDGQEGLKYDNNSYFTVVYVEYAEESGDSVRVSNMTAWHNEQGSTEYMPELSDISSVTDNGGEAAVDNGDIDTRGKTDIGDNAVILDFWNSQETGSFSILKKVTGSLGDISKEFEFNAVFSGLAANTEYHITNNGTVLGDGFTGESFLTDEFGDVELSFKLRSNTGFGFDGLPAGAEFSVTEDKSDHDPGYTVYNNAVVVSNETMYTHGALSTGIIETEPNGVYLVEFVNKRNAAPVTGVAENGTWWTGLGIMAIAASAAIACYIYALIRFSMREKGSPTTFS